MTSISSYAPSFRATNSENMKSSQPNNATTISNNDSKIGAKDIVLGSLATIGVIGMADVLLFKGKGINKLTGVAKKLKASEGMEQRAKNAEELAAKAEERAVRAETRATDAEARVAELHRKLDVASGERLADLAAERERQRPLHEGFPDVVKWYQGVYSDALDFSKNEKDYLPKRIKNILYQNHYDMQTSGKAKCFEVSVDHGHDLKAPKLVMPTIISNETGRVFPGKFWVPKSMEGINSTDIKFLPNGNSLIHQKTDEGSLIKAFDTEGNVIREFKFSKNKPVE